MIGWLISIIEAAVVIGGLILIADYVDCFGKEKEAIIERIWKKLRGKAK